MPVDVFISYSSDDRVVADNSCGRLEDAGIRCWIAPRDLRAGDNWSTSIVRAIEECRIVLLIVSQSTQASRHVLREVERADSNDKQVVPFLLGDVVSNEWVAYYTGAVQGLSASVTPTDEEFKKLVVEIQSALQSRTKPEKRRASQDGSVADEDIVALGRSICWTIREVLEEAVSPEDRETIREPERGQQVKFIDLNCNRVARLAISRWESRHSCSVLLTGEDIDSRFAAHRSQRPAVICCLDSLDGTQHWLRSRNLYCTAVSFFAQSQEQSDHYELRVSVVQNADGTVFVAREDSASAFIDGAEEPIRASTHSTEEIEKAHVCTVSRRPAHYRVLGQYLKEGSPFSGLYSFGGNPILAELALGRYDAVFQPDAGTAGSSHPIWDWLPGGHIAYRSGCTILHLDGRVFDVPRVAEASLTSGSAHCSYVAANSQVLATRIVQWLSSAQ